MLKSFQPYQTQDCPFEPILPISLKKYSQILSYFLCYLFRSFNQKKSAKTIVGDLLNSSQDFQDIIQEMKAILLSEENVEL